MGEPGDDKVIIVGEGLAFARWWHLRADLQDLVSIPRALDQRLWTVYTRFSGTNTDSRKGEVMA